MAVGRFGQGGNQIGSANAPGNPPAPNLAPWGNADPVGWFQQQQATQQQSWRAPWDNLNKYGGTFGGTAAGSGRILPGGEQVPLYYSQGAFTPESYQAYKSTGLSQDNPNLKSLLTSIGGPGYTGGGSLQADFNLRQAGADPVNPWKQAAASDDFNRMWMQTVYDPRSTLGDKQTLLNQYSSFPSGSPAAASATNPATSSPVSSGFSLPRTRNPLLEQLMAQQGYAIT